MSQDRPFATHLQEVLVNPLQSLASRLQRALFDPGGEELLPTLRQNYLEERRLVRQLRAHAALMPNALFRDTYAQVIAETERHTRLLAAQLQKRDSPVPADNDQTLAEAVPTTMWRLIAEDIAAISALSSRYQTQLGWMADAQVQQLLHQIREQQQRQRRVLSDLLARVDSYAMPEINRQVGA